MVSERRYFPPVTVRSRLLLELTSELAGMPDWPHKQVRLQMRNQETDEWVISLYASDCPDAISEVASGEVQVAIINPSEVLTLAVKGTGPFKEPIPLRAITVLGSYDQLEFAVTESSGLRSLEDIRERRFPLKVALRGQRDHSVHLVVNEVLAAVGFSIDDIVSWGGQVHYHLGVTEILDSVKGVERGEIDAIFDEGIGVWTNKALDAGMRVLPLEEALLQKLEATGFRRGTMEKARYPKLPSDVETLDFSGFAVYTHADTPDEVIRSLCPARKFPQHLHERPHNNFKISIFNPKFYRHPCSIPLIL